MKRCYILGSGFSKACGLPLASELTKNVFNHTFPLEDDFLNDRREDYLRYIHHLYPECDLNNTWPDFEELITVLDELEKYRSDYEGAEITNPPNPKHLKERLLKHLGLYLCQETERCGEVQKNLIKDFVQRVIEEESGIISFNWDILLEIACQGKDIAVHYKDNEEPGLSIAKPHGSLNLAPTTRKKYKERLEHYTDLSVEWENQKDLVVRTSSLKDAANKILYTLKEALLVEPSTRKSYEHPWITLQWKKAMNMLQKSHEIIIIGYSLPGTDIRPRILLQFALYDSDISRIHLIDPKADEKLLEISKIIYHMISSVLITVGVKGFEIQIHNSEN